MIQALNEDAASKRAQTTEIETQTTQRLVLQRPENGGEMPAYQQTLYQDSYARAMAQSPYASEAQPYPPTPSYQASQHDAFPQVFAHDSLPNGNRTPMGSLAYNQGPYPGSSSMAGSSHAYPYGNRLPVSGNVTPTSAMQMNHQASMMSS